MATPALGAGKDKKRSRGRQGAETPDHVAIDNEYDNDGDNECDGDNEYGDCRDPEVAPGVRRRLRRKGRIWELVGADALTVAARYAAYRAIEGILDGLEGDDVDPIKAGSTIATLQRAALAEEQASWKRQARQVIEQARTEELSSAQLADRLEAILAGKA